MTFSREYTPAAPTRAEVDGFSGASVVEFGTGWCEFCRAAQPFIESAFATHPGVRHFKVEDGSGRPLGRLFKVKLWPTLIFMRDGQEIVRLVRPGNTNDIRNALRQIDMQQTTDETAG